MLIKCFFNSSSFWFSAAFRSQFSALRLPPSAIRLPPSAFRLPPSACRLPPSAFRLPPSAFRHPPSACRLPPAACRLPPSAFRLPPSAFRLPPFAFRLPLSPVLPSAVQHSCQNFGLNFYRVVRIHKQFMIYLYWGLEPQKILFWRLCSRENGKSLLILTKISYIN